MRMSTFQKKSTRKSTKAASQEAAQKESTFAHFLGEIRAGGKSTQLAGATFSLHEGKICFLGRKVPANLSDSQIWTHIYGASDRLAHELVRLYPNDAEKFETAS